jgi:ADP-heptose:LPS heptosyltransferase
MMCKRVGIRNPRRAVDIFLSSEELAYAHAIVSNLKRPIITIQTTSNTGDFDNGRKLWPGEHWEQLIGLLWEKNINILHLGNSGEQPVKNAVNLLGKHDIRRAIALIKNADLHVGIVSSLMHGAAAVGTPALILYGGFERYSFHGYGTVYPLESTLSCAPCIEPNTLIKPCVKNNKCMRDISPATVFEKVMEILAHHKTNTN